LRTHSFFRHNLEYFCHWLPEAYGAAF
jgi:hypothetical protein